MTKDEAVEIWKQNGLRSFCEDAGQNMRPEIVAKVIDDIARSDVAGFIALGMLSVAEEPCRSATQRALMVLGDGEWRNPEELESLLASVGVAIVDRPTAA